MERAAGFNVGVDAHIDPKPYGTTLYDEWDGVNMTFPHSTGCGCKPTWRDDVGIVPYIPAELHTIQRGTMKPSGFGRLVAAPTGYWEKFVTHTIAVRVTCSHLTVKRVCAMLTPIIG